MDLKRLRYFVAVAEEQNFGRAAGRLNIAQPPLSRQIAQLEGELSVTLIDRSRKQIRLTQAGQILLERSRQILLQVDRTFQEVQVIGRGKQGLLRIGFVGSASYGELPSLLNQHRLHHSEVDLALHAMNNAELEGALVRRELDIAIARPHLDNRDFDAVLLSEEPFVLAVPSSSPLLAKEQIHLKDLAGETLVSFPRRPRPAYVDQILSMLDEAGVTPKDLVLTQDFQTGISLVSVGAGVAIVPESVSSSPRTGVVFRQFLGPNPNTKLTVHARSDNRSPHVINFMATLRKFRQTPKG
ncbi:LysR substrate-binding domain-containing protein [Sulfitobacter sp. F26204]|uniref:LysR substrate-binding domain-containing protein n=1 Tax=Sulfitobacter sp. F26204 TaxID=2996014 RepID=UPI00225E49B7|nr:LysR substrate-binding domain-containing protein [Sulfitobacter sp. F26204]MCX7561714.1 LysR substrate-binding domain-containing protein [Sulfitobacter sp. F26204]